MTDGAAPCAGDGAVGGALEGRRGQRSSTGT